MSCFGTSGVMAPERWEERWEGGARCYIVYVCTYLCIKRGIKETLLQGYAIETRGTSTLAFFLPFSFLIFFALNLTPAQGVS